MSLTSAWGGAGKGLRQSFANILAVGDVELHSFRARSCAMFLIDNDNGDFPATCNTPYSVGRGEL